jgi:O-methyltransferase
LTPTATRILSFDREMALLHWLKKVDNVPGAAAECGVYCGSTLRMLAKAAPDRRFFGFDTFTGLPAAMWSEGEVHQPGDFADTSLNAVQQYVAQCPNVRLVRGEFPASTSRVPLDGETFAFVHLDFDFYESTRAALDWLLPRMSPGGVIVFDDYEWHRCPGVKRAIDELGLKVEKTVQYQAVYQA